MAVRKYPYIDQIKPARRSGLTGKDEGLFQQIDRSISDLEGILVTHEHIDHIKGLGVLAENINYLFMLIRRHGRK